MDNETSDPHSPDGPPSGLRKTNAAPGKVAINAGSRAVADPSPAPLERTLDTRPVVAHVNQLFFLSTQSFIYFYLSHLRRFRPICLTRAPESPAIRPDVPVSLAPDFHLYGAKNGVGQGNAAMWSLGLKVRRQLTRLPPRIAEPLLNALHDRLVPRLRTDTDPAHYIDWVSTIVQRERAVILHAYFAPLGWRLLELKRKLGLPLVVTFLGDDSASQIGSWWWWLIRSGSESPDWPARLRELLAEGDLFLVEGPFMRQRLIDAGCPPGKVQVQRFGLPLQQYKPKAAAANRPDRPTVILFAGRFCEQKGLLYALDAVRQLHAEGRRIEFRIIGDETLTHGHYAARVYAFIREHGLQPCVRLLGFLNHDEYLRELAEADVFLHPSVVDRDGVSEGGAPTTILEAQALGVPVVSTWHCDIPHVTLPGESAVLVAERDSAALAQALRRLVDDPDLRTRMGHAGRKFMAERHDIEREAQVLEDRYSVLLNQHGNTVLDARDPHVATPARPGIPERGVRMPAPSAP
ncbi:MAG: glycosyltransferase [Burkholderiales bacterium]